MTEFLTSGAVQVEIDGVISIHKQLGDGPGKLKARRRERIRSCRATDECGRNGDQSQRQSRDEERK